MRYQSSSAALALALLSTSSAMNIAKQQDFALLADMGLNPDGTPMAAAVAAQLSARSTMNSAKFRNLMRRAANETITPEYVELPIDNFAKDKKQNFHEQGTFFNRFWVAESAYKPGGPVFVYDVGEANAETNALFRLQNETSFFKQMVDSFGGIGIVWEHRFCKCDNYMEEFR